MKFGVKFFKEVGYELEIVVGDEDVINVNEEVDMYLVNFMKKEG